MTNKNNDDEHTDGDSFDDGDIYELFNDMVNRKKCISLISRQGQCCISSTSQNPTCCNHDLSPGQLWILGMSFCCENLYITANQMLVEKCFKAPLTVTTWSANSSCCRFVPVEIARESSKKLSSSIFFSCFCFSSSCFSSSVTVAWSTNKSDCKASRCLKIKKCYS